MFTPNGLFYRDSVMLNVVKHLEKVSCKVRANERNVNLFTISLRVQPN